MKTLLRSARCIALMAMVGTASAQGSRPATLNLMPVPRSIAMGSGALAIDSSFSVSVDEFNDARLGRTIQRTITRLGARTGMRVSRPVTTGKTGTLLITTRAPGAKVPSLDEDESYHLTVTSAGIHLESMTSVGIMRGVETLLQLIEPSAMGGFQIPAVTIDDAPRYRWRGLLIDVARHWMPVEDVKRTLDGMAEEKLNVLHWHLSEDQGIRVESKLYPKLAQMGSDGLYYTQDQIRDVVAYATDRGIRVVPEFDMPGHSTAWFVGYPQYASAPGPYEIARTWGTFPGTFDPTKEATYTFIDGFIGEMAALFPDAYWHIGGDEVNPTQWKASTPIQAFMKSKGLKDENALQAMFNTRLLAILTKHHKYMIGWDEILHPDLPKASIIQSWRGTNYLATAAQQGYQSILSAPYYIDHMNSAEAFYTPDPIPADTKLTAEQQKLVLGGEIAMWAEYVSPETRDSRLWPRSAAVAERFWSPQGVTDVADMYRRLAVESVRLEALGLRHASHIDRMARGIATDPNDAKVVRDAAQVLIGPDFGQGRGMTQQTPMTRMPNVVLPEAPMRWPTLAMARRLVAHPDDRAAADSLRGWFSQWSALPSRVRTIVPRAPLANDALGALDVLAKLTATGNEAIAFITSGRTADAAWITAADALLKTAGTVQTGQMRVGVVPVFKTLIDGAAKR